MDNPWQGGAGVFKASCDRYRVIKGKRFVNFLISPTDEQIAACRAAGVHFRRLDGDLFIPEAEMEQAHRAVPLRPMTD